MTSTGGTIKGNIGAGGVVNSQTGSIASQAQIVTSQSPNNAASMIGGQMQIISPLQVTKSLIHSSNISMINLIRMRLVFTDGPAFRVSTTRASLGHTRGSPPAHAAGAESHLHSGTAARRNDFPGLHSTDQPHSDEYALYNQSTYYQSIETFFI